MIEKCGDLWCAFTSSRTRLVYSPIAIELVSGWNVNFSHLNFIWKPCQYCQLELRSTPGYYTRVDELIRTRIHHRDLYFAPSRRVVSDFKLLEHEFHHWTNFTQSPCQRHQPELGSTATCYYTRASERIHTVLWAPSLPQTGKSIGFLFSHSLASCWILL